MGAGKDSGKVLDIKTADIKATAPVFHTRGRNPSTALTTLVTTRGRNPSTALTTLVTTLDGLGAPWGDDERAGQGVRRRLPPSAEGHDPDGVTYAFSYDTELRLTKVTNPQGLTWSYSYDEAGRLAAETTSTAGHRPARTPRRAA